MQNTTFVAFDTETTGLQPGFHQLVEIGAVRFKGDEILDEFHSLAMNWGQGNFLMYIFKKPH